MFVYQQLLERQRDRKPVRVGLIGAGKFGSMFLSQVPTTPALEVRAIADLDPDRARQACREVGWTEATVDATRFTDDAQALISSADIDVVVEATGVPAAGIQHARAAIAAAKHIVMVNVEADVLAGALLAEQARDAGVVYSMAYGDQPALTCELVEWARASGFEVVAAGKGTKYLPAYHSSTPDTVWEHYGLSAEQARAAGMNSQMFNSFLDGTKSALEMAAIANATGLTPAPSGLAFPPCGMDDLAHVLRPSSDGGLLHHKGQVEVVSSLERDGRPVAKDLRWGVYVVIEAPNDYAAACFQQYGMNTDSSGRYSAMYKPFHLIGLELNISILSAALLGRPTGSTQGFIADVGATAKRDLAPGETLDGEGGFTVYGSLLPAAESLRLHALPIGLAHGITLKNPIAQGQILSWNDVELGRASEAHQIRQQLEQAARAALPTTRKQRIDPRNETWSKSMKIAYLVKVRPDLDDIVPDDVTDYVRIHAGDDGRYSEADLAKVRDVDAFVIGMEPVHEQILAAAPNLKIVQRLGVGYETLDLDAIAQRQIPACNIEGVNKEAVAEHTMTLLLALAKKLPEADRYTQQADWAGARILTQQTFELKDKTIGIIGFGNTGSSLAKRAAAFEMQVLYNDPKPGVNRDIADSIGARAVDLDELLTSADIVSISTDLNDSSRNLIDAHAIAKMQPHALLLCCARGGIVDEQALADALRAGQIAGAGIDVFEVEPIPADNPLIGTPNCILTAHVAGVAHETTMRIWQWAHDNVRSVVQRGERARWIRNGV